jgi:hypothetical protein
MGNYGTVSLCPWIYLRVARWSSIKVLTILLHFFFRFLVSSSAQHPNLAINMCNRKIELNKSDPLRFVFGSNPSIRALVRTHVRCCVCQHEAAEAGYCWGCCCCCRWDWRRGWFGEWHVLHGKDFTSFTSRSNINWRPLCQFTTRNFSGCISQVASTSE